MITDLANRGPSNRATSDLGASSKKDLGKNSQSEESGSFDQIFQQKSADKKSEPNIRSGVATPNKSEPRTAPKEVTGDEPGSVKDKVRSEKVGKKSNNQSQDRQDVMLKFMDSMESEFGIPPTQIVEAMTNLSDRDLKASPEDSASQVIAQLDLSKEDEPKAYAMYMAMVAQLNQQLAPLPQYSAPPPLIVAGGAAVMAAPQQRRALINNSLDQMNQKFFIQKPIEVKPQGEPEGLMDVGDQTMGKPLAESHGKIQVDARPEFEPGFRPDLGSQPASPAKIEPAQGYENTAVPQSMQAIDPNSIEAQEMAKKLAALSFAAGTLTEDLKADPRNLQARKAEQALNKMGAMQASAGTESAFPAAISAPMQGNSEDDDSGDLTDNSSSQNQFFAHQPAGHVDRQPAHHAQAGPAANESFGAMMATAGARGANQAASQSENKAAVQQIMNQTEFMIKKGGGEAKIQLNPEGLGEIHMKVSVNDGKVGIQMSAETKEAKKLIESSLNDLRSSLGEHKLSVGHVKVDVGNQASSENNNSESQKQQRQMDMNQDQSREQAREFWGQFNQGSDRRNGFMENTGIRAYDSAKRRDPLSPDNTTAVTEKRFNGSGKGRGLNLVA